METGNAYIVIRLSKLFVDTSLKNHAAEADEKEKDGIRR